MPILYRTPNSSHNDNFIVEDPDPTKSRIFIENMGCDVKNLSIRFGEFFFRQETDGVYNPYTSDDFSNYPPMYTQNKSAYFIAAYANQQTEAPPGHCDPWLASLDYENYPGARQVKTSSGLIVMGRYSGYSTTTGLADYWIGYDTIDSATYHLKDTGNLCTMLYEDAQIQDEYYVLKYNQGTTYLGKLGFTAQSVTYTNLRSSAGTNIFFVGKCTDDTAMYAEVNGNNQNIEFYNCPSRSTPTLVYTYYSREPDTFHYQYPSNIRHDADTKKVFYQCGWDAHPYNEYKQLFMERFIFNPETKTVVSAPCQLIYPEGKTSVNYIAPFWYESTWHASTRNAWFYKPHQFSIGQRKFITVLSVDKYQPNSFTQRAFYYRGVNRNRWITYEISNSNDTVLTYHSVISWDETRSYPRYYMPINESGTQLLVIKNEDVCTVTFDVENGWYKHDFEYISARSAAIDTAGRIYIATTGANTYYDTNANRYDNSNGNSWCRVYQYQPSVPTSIEAYFENTAYTYTGTNISTSIKLSARNSAGQLVAKNLRVTMIGDNVFFNDNTQIADVTTLTTGELTVPVTITGSGKPSITVTVI